jgi:hypothetical protein
MLLVRVVAMWLKKFERRLTMDKPTQKWIYNQDQADVCDHCANTYQVLHLDSGEDYNDFGFRYCPFCGKMTEQLANIKAA